MTWMLFVFVLVRVRPGASLAVARPPSLISDSALQSPTVEEKQRDESIRFVACTVELAE